MKTAVMILAVFACGSCLPLRRMNSTIPWSSTTPVNGRTKNRTPKAAQFSLYDRSFHAPSVRQTASRRPVNQTHFKTYSAAYLRPIVPASSKDTVSNKNTIVKGQSINRQPRMGLMEIIVSGIQCGIAFFPVVLGQGLTPFISLFDFHIKQLPRSNPKRFNLKNSRSLHNFIIQMQYFLYTNQSFFLIPHENLSWP